MAGMYGEEFGMVEVVGFNERKAVKEKDNRLWSVREMLAATARDLEKGEVAVVVKLQKRDDTYQVSWAAAGLSASEMIALLETAKSMLLSSMGY